MTHPAASTSETAIPPMPDTPFVRGLKFTVVAMGIMIVLGILTVIGRIVYLASNSQKQAVVANSSARLAPAVKLALPAGAQVRQLSLSGDRLAVHYESTAGAGIAVVSLTTGAVLSRIEVVPELPQ